MAPVCYRKLERSQMTHEVSRITDDMVHAALKVKHPALYRDALRHPDNGPSLRKDTERDIELMRNMLAAAMAVQDSSSASAGGQVAPDSSLTEFKERVFELLGCGSAVDPSAALESIRNLVRREACLSAIEREYFTVAIPPDPSEGETEPGDECVLRWGQDPEAYVRDFGGAVHNLGMMMAELSPAARSVLAERHRQISAKGYTPAADDRYTGCELAAAAATYAVGTKPSDLQVLNARVWPWPAHTFHFSTYRRSLEKAGALILAELERLDRRDGVGYVSTDVSGHHQAPFTLAELLEVRRAVAELVGTDQTSAPAPLLIRAVRAGYLSCEQYTVANVDALDKAIGVAQFAKEQ